MAKGSAKPLKVRLNIPIVLTLSVIPDVDILFRSYFQHRTVTHSIVMVALASVPFFIVYGKTVIPYLLALLQHFLIADYIAGGRIQLLWPLSTQYYGLGVDIKSETNMTIELALFLLSMIIMFKAGDFSGFFQARFSNLLLAIPFLTVLLPMVVDFPMDVPVWLIAPHLFYLGLFLVSMTISVPTVWKSSIFSALRKSVHVKNRL